MLEELTYSMWLKCVFLDPNVNSLYLLWRLVKEQSYECVNVWSVIHEWLALDL